MRRIYIFITIAFFLTFIHIPVPGILTMKKFSFYSLRITIAYFLLGLFWISTSDYFLELIAPDKTSLSQFQSLKGWFYVTVTSFLLYLLASKYERVLKRNILDLKNANNDLKTFLYKSSHDLKGPMASILGLTNLFKAENPTFKTSQIIEKIEACSRQSGFIVDDLVKLADILEKNAAPTHINIDAVIEEILDDLRRKKKWNPEIVLEKQIQLKEFISDHQLIYIVLEKIFENAVTFQNPAAPYKNIKLKAWQKKDIVAVEVKDNGLGIEKEQLDKIFEMFYRGSENSKGSGLGLYIAKLATERLKGRIKIFSKPGKGTKLTLLIPVIPKS